MAATFTTDSSVEQVRKLASIRSPLSVIQIYTLIFSFRDFFRYFFRDFFPDFFRYFFRDFFRYFFRYFFRDFFRDFAVYAKMAATFTTDSSVEQVRKLASISIHSHLV